MPAKRYVVGDRGVERVNWRPLADRSLSVTISARRAYIQAVYLLFMAFRALLLKDTVTFTVKDTSDRKALK
jgi:hypothetical protein